MQRFRNWPECFGTGRDDREGRALRRLQVGQWHQPQTATIVVSGVGDIAHHVAIADPFYHGLAATPLGADAVSSNFMLVSGGQNCSLPCIH